MCFVVCLFLFELVLLFLVSIKAIKNLLEIGSGYGNCLLKEGIYFIRHLPLSREGYVLRMFT